MMERTYMKTFLKLIIPQLSPTVREKYERTIAMLNDLYEEAIRGTAVDKMLAKFVNELLEVCRG